MAEKTAVKVATVEHTLEKIATLCLEHLQGSVCILSRPERRKLLQLFSQYAFPESWAKGGAAIAAAPAFVNSYAHAAGRPIKLGFISHKTVPIDVDGPCALGRSMRIWAKCNTGGSCI
jgi:hypothetical protein